MIYHRFSVGKTATSFIIHHLQRKRRNTKGCKSNQYITHVYPLMILLRMLAYKAIKRRNRLNHIECFGLRTFL